MTEIRVAELVDKRDIEEVLLRYCRGVDRGDLDLIRSAYHPDAWEHHGAYRGNSVPDFLEYATGRSGAYRSVCHYVMNHLIELDGDTAYSEAYAVAVHVSGSEAPLRHEVFGGRYVDRMERREGRWAIADRVVVVDWSRDDRVGMWEREPMFAAGVRGHQDVSYARGVPGPGQLLRAAAD